MLMKKNLTHQIPDFSSFPIVPVIEKSMRLHLNIVALLFPSVYFEGWPLHSFWSHIIISHMVNNTFHHILMAYCYKLQ